MEAKQLESIPAAGASHGARNFLHYGIARTVKGFGFPGAGTNRAHNLPLSGNPSHDAPARSEFHEATTRLFVPEPELRNAVAELATHAAQNRPLERDHALATRRIATPTIPGFQPETVGGQASPMAALDHHFSALVQANPALRPRVGNPDELRSNRLDHTLDLLKHRVREAEAGVAESSIGGVITALNEETVVCAALANKGGINLVVTYEAFAPKMLGALRQEITFARQLVRAGRPPGWLSVPVVLTSHTWENSKNEISHQDPTLCEALLGEMADAVSVVFPPDANATVAVLNRIYSQHGRIVAMIVPKREVTNALTWEEAQRLAARGTIVLHGHPRSARVILAATGAYQLAAASRAHQRLGDRGIESALVYVAEPGRLRTPRDDLEATQTLDHDTVAVAFPPGIPRVFLTHTRPEPYLGALRRVDTGPTTTEALGFINRGGTLDIDGMLFANRSTWAHVVAAAGRVMSVDLAQLLDAGERDAIEGRGDPRVLRQSEIQR